MNLHTNMLPTIAIAVLLGLTGTAAIGELLDDATNPSAGNNITGAEYSAVIRAEDSAVLSSRMDGLIEQVSVREGDTFKQGEILIELDCTLQYAQLEKALAQHAYAKKEYQSNRKLKKLNSASELQLAASESATRQAKADLATATHQARLCTIKAPFDGVVVKRHVNAHEVVQAKTELLEIVNNTSLVVEFLAPSNALASLVTGLAFRLVISETGMRYEATIDRVVPHIDPVSQTIKVISTLDEHDNVLWSGMSGWAQMR